MNKYVLFVFLILATNVYASSGVEKKNIDSKNSSEFVVATDENLEKLNISESTYNKIVKEYYKDEISLIGDEFSQKLLIAQNLNNTYIFILNSSVNCGSVGCGGVMSENKTGKSENLRY